MCVCVCVCACVLVVLIRPELYKWTAHVTVGAAISLLNTLHTHKHTHTHTVYVRTCLRFMPTLMQCQLCQHRAQFVMLQKRVSVMHASLAYASLLALHANCQQSFL